VIYVQEFSLCYSKDNKFLVPIIFDPHSLETGGVAITVDEFTKKANQAILLFHGYP